MALPDWIFSWPMSPSYINVYVPKTTRRGLSMADQPRRIFGESKGRFPPNLGIC